MSLGPIIMVGALSRKGVGFCLFRAIESKEKNVTPRYKILGPLDTQEAKKYLGKYCWFRSTYEKAVNLPHDSKFAQVLFDIREGLLEPYYGASTMLPHEKPEALKQGCGYIVVLEGIDEE